MQTDRERIFTYFMESDQKFIPNDEICVILNISKEILNDTISFLVKEDVIKKEDFGDGGQKYFIKLLPNGRNKLKEYISSKSKKSNEILFDINKENVLGAFIELGTLSTDNFFSVFKNLETGSKRLQKLGEIIEDLNTQGILKRLHGVIPVTWEIQDYKAANNEMELLQSNKLTPQMVVYNYGDNTQIAGRDATMGKVESKNIKVNEESGDTKELTKRGLSLNKWMIIVAVLTIIVMILLAKC